MWMLQDRKNILQNYATKDNKSMQSLNNMKKMIEVVIE